MGMPPLALAMVICDTVWVDPSTGKRTILGTFSAIFSTVFPVKLPQLAVYIALTDARGVVPIKFRVVDVDEARQPVYEHDSQISFKDPLSVSEGTIMLRGAEFPQPGEYRVQLFCDGELIIERRLMVISGEQSKDEATDADPS
jgi:hypothetical protein